MLVKNCFIDKLIYGPKEGIIPNLIITGPPGSGKTTTVNSLIYEKEKIENTNVKFINVSENGGVDTIRNELNNFLFLNKSPHLSPFLKIIIIDEADSLTGIAQESMRRLMERTSKFARFILICNIPSNLTEALQSRCVIFKFRKLKSLSMLNYILNIFDNERKKANIPILEFIVANSNGDMRFSNNLISLMGSDFDGFETLFFKKVPGEKILKFTSIFLKEIANNDLEILRDFFLDLIDSENQTFGKIVFLIQRAIRDSFITKNKKIQLIYFFSKLGIMNFKKRLKKQTFRKLLLTIVNELRKY